MTPFVFSLKKNKINKYVFDNKNIITSMSAPGDNPPPGDKYPFLIYSDVMTFVAAGLESKIYTGKMDLKSVGMYGLVGIVSRYIENFLAKQNVNEKFLSNDYREQKNQFIVFVINYLLTSSKINPFMHGLRGVNADLLGKWMVDAMTTDKPLFSMSM